MERPRHINWRRVAFVGTISTAVVALLASCGASKVQPDLNQDGSVRVTATPQENLDPQNESFSGSTQHSEQNSTTSEDPRATDPNFIYYQPMDTYYEIVPDPYSYLGSNNKCVRIGEGQTPWGAASVLSGDPAVFYDPVAINVTVFEATESHNVIGSFTTQQSDQGLAQIDTTRIPTGSTACNEGEIINH